jgi:peroxiredoxin Q/BCP
MIRENFPLFEKLDLKIMGISADSVESHKKFAKKHNLPFTLLSDEKKEVVEKYDVLRKKLIFGRTVFGIKRTSFLINEKGKIVKIYEKVKPAIHAHEVLNDLQELKK